MVMCHGVPISELEDGQFVMSIITELDGFIGASSIERFAVELSIKKL